MELPVKREIALGGNINHTLKIDALPKGISHAERLGLVVADGLLGDVLYTAPDGKHAYETRGTCTPGGDILIMFPMGDHYGSRVPDCNQMLSIRSKDGGKTWSEAAPAEGISGAKHGFIPLIPFGSRDIYCFGTQPIPGLYAPTKELHENAPIGWYISHDDGYTWEGPRLISPVEDPTFTGMSVMRMGETARGTWLLGSHEAYWHPDRPLDTFQYILRSEDQGETWHILPGPRCQGFQCPGFGRMDEGRVIALGGDEAIMMIRTPEGHLWLTRTQDDGRTWSEPQPTPLIHPDAPPMLTRMGDTLVCLYHNRHHDLHYSGLSGKKPEIMADRSELWASFSEDKGHSWTEPRLLLVNACAPHIDNPYFEHQCSYADLFAVNDTLHIIFPHLWQRVLHLTISEADIRRAPTVNELFR